MVKSVVVDETQFKSTESRLFNSNPPSEIGLIVGKLNPSLDRAFIFDLIPTPPNDDGHPPSSLSSPKPDPKKKPSKSKSQSDPPSLLLLDTDWIAEHARQVSQMLLGGVNVIGIYLWSPESSFNSSQPPILQVIKALASESILLHICYSPRKLVVRNCGVGSNSFRICDFKMGTVLASLKTFKCLHRFQLRFPVPKDGNFRDVIREGILGHEKELTTAKAIVDGDLVVDDDLGWVSDDGSHNVELLLPVTGNDFVGGLKGEIVGVVVFTGFVCGMAYLCPKESIRQGIADIKGDIVMSLQSRLNIICDAAEEGMESMGGRETDQSVESIAQLGLRLMKKPTTLAFPRRVLVPWIGDTLICDYLQPVETLDVVIDHCKELMSMVAPPDTSLILEPEKEAISFTVKSFWDVIVPSYSVTGSVSNSMVTEAKDSMQSKAPDKSTTFSIVTVITILLLAILIGYLHYSS